MSTHRRNRLAEETSPYLLQHADNPVDWYPWNEEALAAARESGKPILLSIGYSACHWCHVMAHESFEDEETAALMNARFVNIKVDREERPDVDRIYQIAHQVLAQRGGGWPLTMFLDHETQRPFFGGTYFPKEARYGMPSFRDLLIRVADYYESRPDEARAQGEQIAAVFGQLDPPAATGAPGRSPIDDARAAIGKSIDREFGGLGSAPKFPHPSALTRLLRHWRATAHTPEPDVEALFLVSLTCSRMAEGGIYDQVGGGFYRYAVDRYWQIPHFEKMLYDNGPLLALYAELHLATGEELFRRVAAETAGWLLEDMQSPGGGFYASLDADSDGEEGRYYVWTREEVRDLLDDEDYDLIASHFGLDREPNFEGRWHLTVQAPLPDVASETEEDTKELRAVVEKARGVLATARAGRTPPGRDEKLLTAWNALAVRGLAIAGRSLDDPAMLDAAGKACRFIRETLVRDGRLYASFKDGQARFPAYLDDHAFLLDALLELLQARWDSALLRFATDLAEMLLEHFLDAEAGGFYFTASDAETLMARPKPLADEATPSGNGVAAFALQRLGFLLGDSRYLDAAESTLRFAWQAMEEYPHGHSSLITALEEYHEHPEIVVLRGEAGEIRRWQASAGRIYAPARLIFAIPEDCDGLPGALAERKARPGETVAYRCIGNHCSLPLTSFEALAAELTNRRGDTG